MIDGVVTAGRKRSPTVVRCSDYSGDFQKLPYGQPPYEKPCDSGPDKHRRQRAPAGGRSIIKLHRAAKCHMWNLHVASNPLVPICKNALVQLSKIERFSP